MAREIFIDTSGFYACLVKRDDRHAAAAAILTQAAKSRRAFVTTDYVLDETATLLRVRGQGHLVAGLFDTVFASRVCRVEWMDPLRFTATRELLAKHGDHAYSFTDCFSFHIMQHLGLLAALTKDAHFREAGFQPLLG